MSGALDGLVVLALEQAVAAPLATSRLADAGARVIKLERPEGDFARHYDSHADGESSYFVWLNRNKESCRVDLTRKDDLALVHRMVRRADIFIQNLAPGATSRFGLGSVALYTAYPRLITCDIAGYAPTTPHGGRKAYDLMIQAEAGIAAITGTPDSGPSRVGISICDIATGLTAHAQILEALIARAVTGKGRAISVALFDVAAELMNIPYVATRHGDAPPERMGLSHPLIAPYGSYPTSDGAILIAVQSDREWSDFCTNILRNKSLIADFRFNSNEARVRNRADLDACVSVVFKDESTQRWVERLSAGRIAYAIVSDMQDFVRHPALALTKVAIGGRSIEIVAPPALIDGIRFGKGSVPSLGAHDEILRAEFS